MAQRNVKYGYAFARFVVSDGVTVATQTLADTSAIPLGAIMTSTTVIARGAIVSSGGSATVQVIAGGLTLTSLIAKAKLDTAGWVVRENVPEDATCISTGADITLAIGTSALDGGSEELDIIVEYILLD